MGGPARFSQSWRVVTPGKHRRVKASSPRAATSSICGVRSGWGGGGEKGTAEGGRGQRRGYLRGQEGLRTTSLARGLPLPGSPRPTSPPRSCRFPRKSPGPTPPGFSSRLPARSPEFLIRQDPGSPAVSSPPSPSACSLGSRRSPSRPACQARAHLLRPDASACSLAHMAHSICPMATGKAVQLSSAGTLSPARQPPPSAKFRLHPHPVP